MQCMDGKEWLQIQGGEGGTALAVGVVGKFVVPKIQADANMRMKLTGNFETWKGWALISVSATNRGPILSLPRFILSPPSPSADVFTLSSTSGSSAQLLPYSPDNSYARFRVFTYGSCTLYICEANLSVLKADLTTIPLSAVDSSAWSVVGTDTNKTITSASTSQTASFQQTISNTGDLPSSLATVRIQIGPSSDPAQIPQVISVDGKGNVISEAWDRLSSAQTWTYLDWDKGVFLLHSAAFLPTGLIYMPWKAATSSTFPLLAYWLSLSKNLSFSRPQRQQPPTLTQASLLSRSTMLFLRATTASFPFSFSPPPRSRSPPCYQTQQPSLAYASFLTPKPLP